MYLYCMFKQAHKDVTCMDMHVHIYAQMNMQQHNIVVY